MGVKAKNLIPSAPDPIAIIVLLAMMLELLVLLKKMASAIPAAVMVLWVITSDELLVIKMALALVPDPNVLMVLLVMVFEGLDSKWMASAPSVAELLVVMVLLAMMFEELDVKWMPSAMDPDVVMVLF